MQFLRTIFWVVIAVLLVVFSISNWTSITITLWSGLLLQTYLPVAIFLAFLLGLVPYFLLHRATKWSLQRKLMQVERQLGEMRSMIDPKPVETPAPGAIPPSAAPIAVPPGVSSTSPIYVAIDTPDLEKAKEIATKVKNHVGGIKLGLEFFSANGRSGVREMAHIGLPIFLDLKLHDIPNTVGKAVQALRPLEPAILTVHAAGGRAMMEDAKAAAPTGTKVVAVTVLTSLDATDLQSIGVDGTPHDQVERLTLLAKESGLDGVVCSGNEVAAARKLWPGGFFVVPGVRPSDGKVGDQKRVVTPRQALDNGASILVIGRPITQAADPDAAARAIDATL